MGFKNEFAFAELHMPAIREALGGLPLRTFVAIDTAPAKRDMEEATDLVIALSGGDIAVRVRRSKYWHKQNTFGWEHEWSVRWVCHGHKTEIHKLREGFARWYFFAFSSDDSGGLAKWWLIDLDAVRSGGLLDDASLWAVNANGDGTSGGYLKMGHLARAKCIVAESVKAP